MDCMQNGFEKGKLLGGRYITESPLNHGSFGMVFTARDIQTGDDVAVKCIAKPGSVDTSFPNCPAAIATDDRSEELPIHSKISNHPNIVNLLNTFETEHHTWMVLELCSNGDLYEAIRTSRGPLETEHVRDFMLQLVGAIEHLHAHSVYHRDIKPENIFLTSSGTMKLGDFGLATTETWSTEFAVGSDRYMAPEQFESSVYGYGYSTASADTWAIGIVLLNILFQRNPFATPTPKDPLFADFANDRQSLFDVFPNMSQDTFNVLVHSLAIDPANRSLPAVRDALEAVVSFTTDDEALDDFCTASQGDPVQVTAGREPLRTPSITSPAMSSGDSYPWTTLLKSPEKQGRQLSTIRDEELFPGSSYESGNGFNYGDPDELSLSSNVDSGLGMSFKSTKSTKSAASKLNNFVGSLPISFTKPGKTSPYGATGFSKSWSDLWDEEEELAEEERHSLESNRAIDMSRASTAKPSTPQLQPVNTILDELEGSATPRPVQSISTATTEERLAPERISLPKRASSSILDKWAALGSIRRNTKAEPFAKVEPAPATPATPTPQKSSKYVDALTSLSPFGSSRKAKQQQQQQELPPKPQVQQPSQPQPVKQRTTSSRSRDRALSSASWRQESPAKLWERKEKEHSPVAHPASPWLADNNWREHKSSKLPTKTSDVPPVPPVPSVYQRPVQEQRKLKNQKSFLETEFSDDIGDLEWVGGWHDFH